MKFTIDPAYLTSITIRKNFEPTWSDTEEDLVKALKHDPTRCYSISNQDHPEFEKLREQLGRDGYIKIERGWWNGDIVTKPFILNGVKFKTGEQFPCAPALSYTLKVRPKTKKIK